MASASGAWMTDTDGRRYLDAYNNVPCVGHSHPRVASAIARQSHQLGQARLMDGDLTTLEAGDFIGIHVDAGDPVA